MAVEVRQLKDRGTGESFVPLTHWDAVSNKPNLVLSSDIEIITYSGENNDIDNLFN